MRILQIQGLRALAALLVVIYHAHLMPGGFIGVDIFYVISGFLITGLILREIESTGRLDLNRFYQRRIKRLVPTSIFVLFVTAAVGLFVLPAITRDALGRDLFAAATYMSNYLFAWWENDYQNLDATPSPFIHYWSLAVEEQFYVVWPIFILFLSRFGKQAIFRGVLAVTVLSLLLSIYQTQTSPIWAFYSLPTRAWELGVGALLLFVPEKSLRFRYAPWIGAIGLGIAAINYDENTSFPGVNAVMPVFATALLIGSISIWPRFFNDLSNNRLSQWLGEISYPLYLWHWPALVLPSSALGRPLTLFERFACIALTIFLAHFTTKFIENPLRHRTIDGKRVYRLFAGSTAISLVAALFISLSASSIIDVKGTRFSFDLNEVVSRPAIYDDGCHVNYGDSESGICTYGDLESDRTIVLYGDSHAAQWFPSLEILARQEGFKLISLTKSACSSVESPRSDRGAFKYADCVKWRNNSIERIQEIKPYAVVVSSFQYFAPPSNFPDRSSWWNDGQRKLLKRLQGSSQNIVYISDTPHPERDIPNCLAMGEVALCDTSKLTPNVIISEFKQIDPNPWMCSEICPAILDGDVAYRDASHISVAAAISMTPKLRIALKENGLFS